MIAKLRLIIFIGVVILLSFCMLFSNEKNLFSILNVTDLTAYADCEMIGYENSLSGNGYSFSCPVSDYAGLKGQVDGFSFETTYTPKEIFEKLNLKIQDIQNIEQGNRSIQIYYCFLENLNSSFVMINSKKINLQIAFNGSFSTVGIPLILGSY